MPALQEAVCPRVVGTGNLIIAGKYLLAASFNAWTGVERDAPVHDGIQPVRAELDEVEIELLLKFQR